MFPSISEFSFAAPGAAVSKPAALKASGKPMPPGPPGGKPPPPGPGKPPARTLQIVIFFLFILQFYYFIF